MPITQERMLACINAGLSAFNALELAKQIIKAQTIEIGRRLNTLDMPAAIEAGHMIRSLEILLTPEALVNTAGPMSYFEAFHQLQMEARHFREFKGRNARAKRQQASKRHNIQKPYPIVNDQTKSLYEQAQEQIKQQTRDKLNKMKNPQIEMFPEMDEEIDYRNYQPEEFE